MSAISVIEQDRRATLGTVLISSNRPAGEDARSSAEFDALDSEIRKLDSEGPNAVDWKMVASGGLDLIEHRSKDFLVGAWVAFALFRREGLAGLAVGLSILNGIIQSHWDGAFPPLRRERARVATFDWLVGRVAPSIADQHYGDADAPHLMAVYDAVVAIDEAASTKLQKESLSLGDLIRALRPHVDQARRSLAEAAEKSEEEARQREAAIRQQAEAEAARAASAAATPVSTPTPVTAAAPPGPMSTPPIPAPAQDATGDFAANLDGLAATLWATARALQQREVGDPRSYALGRIGSWLRFDAPPPDQGGRTFIVAPGALAEIEVARGLNMAETALHAAEELVWSAPFCLDAHRHSFELLGKLDRDLEPARAAVLGMLGYLVGRFPRVLELSFSDGRPFADDATRALIDTARGASGAATSPRDAMVQAVSEARALMGAGKAYEGLDLLTETLRRAESLRQRSRWQMAQAEFCIDQGYVSASLPLLDHLDRIIEDRALEHWEPDFACSVTQLRLRALMHAEAQMMLPEDRRRNAIELARGRLARLDIGATVRSLRP